MDKAAALRGMYDTLDTKLKDAKGSGAAAVVREMRILAGELARIEQVEVSKVDQLAARRKSKTGAGRPPARRRKPGRSAAGD